MPAWRTLGSAYFTACNLGETSTPKSATVIFSNGFFFACIIFGNFTNRGSFKRKSAVITAGSFRATVSKPPSISRVTSTSSPPKLTLLAKVPWPAPIRAASICPVWFASLSIACLPKKMSCGCSLSAMAFSTFATAKGSKFSSASTKIALSPPIAKAVRKVSSHLATPIDTTTTSLILPASFWRTASSTAISSKGFIDILTLFKSTPEPSVLTRALML